MSAKTTSPAEQITQQLDVEKRSVSYDAYDITIRQLVDMASAGVIDIAPEYQRHFVWDDKRESELVESVFLGIPVPSLYMATNKDGSWEVVDGVQRLSTLLHFCGNSDLINMVGRKQPLRLTGLKTLTAFNDRTYLDLPQSVQLNFTLRPLRVTTLNDKSDMDVRYELFERLNTGGVLLHPQEIRASIFRGDFNEQIRTLSKNKSFRKVVKIRKGERTEAVYEECVLRFFAFLGDYKNFEHLVEKFLNDYMKKHIASGVPEKRIKLFEKTMEFLAKELPSGIVRGNRSITPINLYEAVAVGTALAFDKGENPKKGKLRQLVNDAKLTALTSGGTNSKRMVIERIEAVRDALS